MKKIIICALILSTLASAKERSQNGSWLGVFSKKELTTEYSWWSEAQLRYSFDQGGMGQFLYRTGALYKLNSSQGLGLLYGYITTGDIKEHRWTLQHSHTYSSTEYSKISARTRFEYRNNEDDDNDSGRLRYLLRYQKNSGILWNEIFLNVTDEVAADHQLFERNRIFVGVEKKIFNSRIEYGYLNQFVPRENTSVVEHLAVLYLFM